MYKPTSIITQKSFELVDVTMRDGALGRRFPYTYEQLEQYLHILESLGIRYAEVGFINGPGKWSDGSVDSPNYDISPQINKQLHSVSSLHLWSMVDSDNNRIKARHIHTNKDSLIRLTVDLDKIHLLEEKIKICKRKNIPFSVNLKHTGSYEVAQIQSIAEFAQAQGAQIFYIVDTSGSMVPSQVAEIIRQLKTTSSIDLGFHGHDSLGFAAANSLVAIEEGCKYIDVSLCGIGAGGGNAITEIFALLALGEGCDWNKLIEAGRLLNISNEYRQLQERIFWGFIGCNTTIKTMLIENNTAEKVASKALEWKYGRILSKGEFTTLRQLSRPEPIVIKTATKVGIEKMRNEITFLERNRTEFHYSFMPDILSHEVTSKYACYSMPFIEGPLLRECIYSEPDLSLCEGSIKQAMHHLQALHQKYGTISAAEFSEKYYIGRLQKRWKKLQSTSNRSVPHLTSHSIRELSSMDVAAIFSYIAKGASLAIDGENLTFSFNHLFSSLKQRRHLLHTPQTSIRLIHGDPHYGNILLHNNDVVLLDPNGFLSGGDIAYDFGKVLISHDWHDMSMMDLVEPARITITQKGIAVTNNRIYKDVHVEKRHKALRSSIIQHLKNDVLPLYRETDPFLLQRTILLLYIHQFAFSPTLIKERPEVALHVLLNAISDYNTLVQGSSFDSLP